MTVYNLSPPRWPKIDYQQLLTLLWRSLSVCRRAYVSEYDNHQRGQYIENKQWCTNVNILRLTVAYQNAMMNGETRNRNQRLELTSLTKPSTTLRLPGPGLGLAHQEAAGRVLGQVWNRTNPILGSKPRPLVGHLDPLLTLNHRKVH